ncbi:MAG: Sb-PDE family phosphodiesterase [Bacteroidales bacterium]|nr:Sb-PDE family phosphodiesterase [Bacteroidales bacterium]
MKKTLLFLVSLMPLLAFSQNGTNLKFPDFDGYKTLKCDFHVHTVFSDGVVWPTTRVDEAVREGLDAIAITDHIEYRPHKDDIKADLNRSYDIAKAAADKKKLLLIRGSEITRQMPPGHLNAIFTKDNNALDTPEWRDALKEAKAQGAFIFWNHPGWKKQQPDTTLWWNEHTEIFNNGYMQAIEVGNTRSYYPEAHGWCLEKKLAMFANSDIHQPTNVVFNFDKGEHRFITLVFAKERSLDGIREAIDNGRTVAYMKESLVGPEEYLKTIFEKGIKVKEYNKSKNDIQITVVNTTPVPFFLKATEHDKNIQYLNTYELRPGKEYTITIMLRNGIQKGKINFEVTNLLAAPNKGLDYSFDI